MCRSRDLGRSNPPSELSQCRSSFPLHITHHKCCRALHRGCGRSPGPSLRPRDSNNRYCQPLIFPNFLTNFAHYHGRDTGETAGMAEGTVGSAIKIKIHAQAKDITRFLPLCPLCSRSANIHILLQLSVMSAIIKRCRLPGVKCTRKRV